MAVVSYNIIFDQDMDFKDPYEIMADALDNITSSYTIEGELFRDCITHRFKKIVGDNKTFISFKLDLDETIPEEELIDIIDSFNDELKSFEAEAVFKYYDNFLFNQITEYHSNIFAIEMNVREIISFIFIDTYGDDFYDLFTEMTITNTYPNDRTFERGLFYSRADLKNDKDKRMEYLKYLFENESFYLSFSQYKEFLKTKKLQENDLLNIAARSPTYEIFKENITERGIREQIYREFLEDIRLPLKNLEPYRNCIAHNRSLSKTECNSLELICDDLNRIIRCFVKKLEDDGIWESF